MPETCQWFLQHTQFRRWQESNYNDLLWLSADPGCGKSVLSRALVDEELATKGSLPTLYFFFKDNAAQSVASLAVCALLHQLFRLNGSLYERHAVSIIDTEGDHLKTDFEALWRLFLTAARDPEAGTIVCILDALDECREADRTKVIAKLKDFYRSAPAFGGRATETTLKFLVTSRPYQDIHLAFDELTYDFPLIRLAGEEESEAISKEIGTVITAEIEKIGRTSCKRESISQRHWSYF